VTDPHFLTFSSSLYTTIRNPDPNPNTNLLNRNTNRKGGGTKFVIAGKTRVGLVLQGRLRGLMDKVPQKLKNYKSSYKEIILRILDSLECFTHFHLYTCQCFFSSFQTSVH